jgi:hypothetical protein
LNEEWAKKPNSSRIHRSHYYGCVRATSGFLKQKRCAQRRIRADVLDELVWDDVRRKSVNQIRFAFHTVK